MCINGTLSTFLSVYSGVPQGSILGPLLFLIYINDLPLYLRSSKCYLFVDDTKVFNRINQQEDTIRLQLDLDFLSLWSHDTDLIFNTIKSNYLSFKCEFHAQYHLDGSDIPIKQLQRDLGVLISFRPDMDLSHLLHNC